MGTIDGLVQYRGRSPSSLILDLTYASYKTWVCGRESPYLQFQQSRSTSKCLNRLFSCASPDTSAPALLLTDEQVTGVSGFLGSHVVDQLLKDGYRVRGWVTFTVSRVRLAELGLQQPSELLAPLKLLLSRKRSLLSLGETAWRSLESTTLSPTTSPRLLRVSGSTVHKGVSTHHLTGASGVLHLASPLVGKLPPAEMLDVRTHSSTPPSAPAQ